MSHSSVTRIFITGGHLTPALALIDEIVEGKLPWNVVFVGRKYALEGDKHVSAEFTIVTGRGIQFLPLTAGRLTRLVRLSSILRFIKIPLGFLQALYYVAAYKPALVISFGGYVGLPVVLAGWIMGVPSVTHEQTLSMGVANRIISVFARKIFLSYPQDAKKTKQSKVQYVGLPLRKQLFEHHAIPDYIPSSTKPIIYITGGATGASSLNALVFPLVPILTGKYLVIHQTGHDSYESSLRCRQNLPDAQKAAYVPREYIDVDDIGWILTHALLVVGRSGANITGEIEALGAVGLFIPLPWSRGAEQLGNAKRLRAKGSSQVLSQKDLTPDALGRQIADMIRDIGRYKDAAKKWSGAVPRNAAATIVKEIMPLISI